MNKILIEHEKFGGLQSLHDEACNSNADSSTASIIDSSDEIVDKIVSDLPPELFKTTQREAIAIDAVFVESIKSCDSHAKFLDLVDARTAEEKDLQTRYI